MAGRTNIVIIYNKYLVQLLSALKNVDRDGVRSILKAASVRALDRESSEYITLNLGTEDPVLLPGVRTSVLIPAAQSHVARPFIVLLDVLAATYHADDPALATQVLRAISAVQSRSPDVQVHLASIFDEDVHARLNTLISMTDEMPAAVDDGEEGGGAFMQALAGSSIAAIAKEIADELVDSDVLKDVGTDPSKIDFASLLDPESKLGGVAKLVSSKLHDQLGSGKLDQAKLMGEVMTMFGNLSAQPGAQTGAQPDNPLMAQVMSMARQMGAAGPKYTHMEVVAFLTLAVAGYIINKRQRVHGPVQATSMPLGDSPTHQDADLYESRQLQRARAIELDAATRATLQSQAPERSGVIPRNFTDNSVQTSMKQRRQGVSELSGLPTNFLHSNMSPFFGGHVRQAMDPTASNNVIERYTGMTAQGVSPPLAKVEQPPMFAPQTGNVYGTPSMDLESAISHLPVEKFRKNDLPFKQVRVGPAIDGGYNAKPNDGYLSGRQFQLPKETNELRTLDDPKVTYAGRTIAGTNVVQTRGELGTVDEVKYPQRYRETFNADDWLKTTGQVLGEVGRPEQILREVVRPCSVGYQGSAGPTAATTASYADAGEQSAPFRSESLRLQLGPASAAMAADSGASVRSDYGRANIMVFSNERDTTNVPVFSGSASTFVKSIMAPLLDMVRPARRQVLGTFAARSFGNTSVTFPDKQTVREPDGVLRTTIREVTQQFTANPGAQGSLRGPTLLTVYDPSDVAKTTLKEQTIHDSTGAFAPAPGRRCTTAREVGDRARTTTRQTLDCTNTSINPWVPTAGQLLRDPDLELRPTVKETTVSAANPETDGTAVGGLQGSKGGHTSSDMTAFPMTTRQFLCLQEDNHVGTAIQASNDAYLVANAEPRPTQKQFLSDNSYYGTSRGAINAQSSHEEYDHATSRPDKEILSVMARGDFGPSGTKEAVGVDDLNVGAPRKFLLETDRDRAPSVGRVMPQTVDVSSLGLPEVGAGETARGQRGSYAQEMAQPKVRFEEDVSAMSSARSTNPVANAGFAHAR